jgi:hypothetical protein
MIYETLIENFKELNSEDKLNLLFRVLLDINKKVSDIHASQCRQEEITILGLFK